MNEYRTQKVENLDWLGGEKYFRELVTDSLLREDRYGELSNIVAKKDELIKKGIFMSPSVVFNSYSHTTEDIEKTLTVFNEACLTINNIVKNDNFKEHIQGKLPTTVWTMKIQPTKKK